MGGVQNHEVQLILASAAPEDVCNGVSGYCCPELNMHRHAARLKIVISAYSYDPGCTSELDILPLKVPVFTWLLDLAAAENELLAFHLPSM